MTTRDIHEKLNSEDLIVLRERDLSRRWKTSQRTLQRWRAEGYGPAYIWIGGAIRYRLADVLAYEERQRRGGDDT